MTTRPLRLTIPLAAASPNAGWNGWEAFRRAIGSETDAVLMTEALAIWERVAEAEKQRLAALGKTNRGACVIGEGLYVKVLFKGCRKPKTFEVPSLRSLSGRYGEDLFSEMAGAKAAAVYLRDVGHLDAWFDGGRLD